MAINNFIITSVNPSNGETNVALDKIIVLNFISSMSAGSLNGNNIRLIDVDANQQVDITITYDYTEALARIEPVSSLLGSHSYSLEITGGSEGVRTLSGDYLGSSKTYSFVTVETPQEEPIEEPEEPIDTEEPTDPVDDTEEPVDDGEDPTDDPDTGETEEPPTNTDDDVIDPGGEDPDEFNLEILETFPRKDEVNVTPETIIIIFSEDVDPATISENSIYLIKRPLRRELTKVDYMVHYAPSKKAPIQIDPIVDEPTNIITLTVPEETILNDEEYTVIISPKIKSITGKPMAEPYVFAFMSKFDHLYGDEESIRDDLRPYAKNIPDRMLYRYMRDISREAYDIVSTTSTFNAADYADGKAPFFVHQYVRYKTSYQLFLNAYMNQIAPGGDDGDDGGLTITAGTIKLGDLTVQGGSESTSSGSSNKSGVELSIDMNDVLEEMKKRIKHWEDLLHGYHNRGYAKPKQGQMSSNSTPSTGYPEFLTRAEYRELGG
ncbi:structural protein [Bacillus phage vB_BauM_KLEB27-3]|nr:structural protein [Bacillus phage vB_BauM_KLEB27-3]